MPGPCPASRKTRSPASSRGPKRMIDGRPVGGSGGGAAVAPPQNRTIQIGYAHRQAPMGREAMVASCHPLPSLAGVEILKSGGNVIDAAIATNAVLAVTQPNFCGVGGDLFCLYHEAATGRVHFLNGAGRSGSRAGLDELKRRGWDAMPQVGPG